jgi:hypothetical protein
VDGQPGQHERTLHRRHLHRKPKDPQSIPAKRKEPPKIPRATLETVDQIFGPLTAEIAARVFAAYDSPLAGNETELISAFADSKLSAWIGLTIIAQESSFANRNNNPSLDARNTANPFSVHFTSPKKWPKGCGKNALLVEAPGENYAPEEHVDKKCAAKDHALPSFARSAQAAAKIVKEKGLSVYREEPGYEDDLNERLNSILRKINLAPK